MSFADLFPEVPFKNPYWTLSGRIQGENGADFKPEDFTTELVEIRKWFRDVYRSTRSEAQCFIVERVKELTFEGARVVTISDKYDMVIPPQTNTPTRTSIDESWWNRHGVHKPIVARVHSHHIMDAYQSETDYKYLNAGLLEIVIGRIDHKDLRVAYWLDDTKTGRNKVTQVTIPLEKGV